MDRENQGTARQAGTVVFGKLPIPPEPPVPSDLADGYFTIGPSAAPGGVADFEQLHRYCLARDICVGRDVLDVTAGRSDGAALLAGVARRAIGLDIEAEGQALPFDDASFDVVVSFGALERLRDQRRFVREVERVLRPGGWLLVGTPDRDVYSAPGQPVDRRHVRELSTDDLAGLLDEFFANHRILRQRAILGSVLAADGGHWRSYDRRAPDVMEATSGLARAFHLIGVASDAPLPEIGPSVYGHDRPLDDMISAADALPKLREALAAERARDHGAQFRCAVEAGAAQAEAFARERQALTDALSATRQELEQTQRANAAHAAMLEAVRVSTWWRLGGPIRVAARRLKRRRPTPPAVAEPVDQAPAIVAEPAPRIDMRAELGLPPHRPTLPAAAQIGLPDYDAPPVVSVVIPTYGQVDHTLRCLASIAAAPPAVPIEVIVVEDASGDPRVAELKAVRGLRLVLREDNLGFLRSCNDAARLANGRFLMLLNNDTEVMPGAIDVLHRLLVTRPDAGLAGARLLYPDGWLQEAGGIIWRDGSGANYGRRDDPRKPEYNYVREADYISGAAIMLPLAVWQTLGGFDEHFAPAYCEDSDLAFRVRAAGLKVLYQPEAQVIHMEGGTHGTDTAAGLKAWQVVNTRKLHDRWRDTLRQHHLPNGTRLMRARDRSLGRTITLVIDHYVPQPDRDAGSRTIMAFLDALLAAGRVVKFLPVGGHPGSSYATALQRRGIEVIDSPWRGSLAAWIAAHGQEIDEVLLSRPHVAEECLPLLAAHCRASVVFYGHDLHHQRLRAEGDPRRADEADAMEALERQVWRAVDVVLYPSEDEAAAVRALEPRVRAFAVPAYALPPPPPAHAPPPASAGLIFVAGFAHPPNVDAACWLVGEILPLLRAARPDLALALIGSNPTPEVRALAGPGIEVTGFVPDHELARRYGAARVAVCPLRFGAGVKLKVIEAMHHGVPLVTTPAGAQGLPGLDAVCDVQSEPAAFAGAVLRLLDDDAAWTARAAAQSAFVAARFSAAAVQAGLERAFAQARPATPGLDG
jgi:GT2 family glycosyltransferase/glycosyltransferase involved in cell wall biosynthesis/SAM-dependent methyltransferase